MSAIERLNELLEAALVARGLPDLVEHVKQDAFDVDWDKVDSDEKMIVIAIKEFARQLGSDQGSYDQGVLSLVFTNRQAVLNFIDTFDQLTVADDVEDFDIEVRGGDDLPEGRLGETIPFEEIMFDGNFEFIVHVYLNPDVVWYAPTEIEADENGEYEYDDENGTLTEVRRKIKVTARGKRWIKMQCRPGFKWNSATRTCAKIGGSDLAKLRRSIRKTVRTKRAMGSTFKTRVLRKQRKAKRFRKAMGLK